MTYLLLIMSVLLSYGFVLLFNPKVKELLQLLLAFSGSFLLALTLFELVPSVYENSDGKTMGLYIMLGILFQVFLEFFSKGAEHGHIHYDASRSTFPWLLLVSLCIHSFIEGIPIAKHQTILYGILVHKVPISLILSVFLLNSGMSRTAAGCFICLFALMTPLGNFLATSFEWIRNYYAALTAVVIGVFLHISTVILFESSEGHRFTFRKLLSIAAGIFIAYLL